MMSWLHDIQNDQSKIVECINHYTNKYNDHRKNLKFSTKSIEKNSAELPGIIEEVHSDLQDLESVVEYINIELKKIRSSKFKQFLEHYQRALSSRDAEKYIDAEEDVVAWANILNEIALIRNKYLSLLKGFDQKGWMVGHITKLRCAGFEDIVIQEQK